MCTYGTLEPVQTFVYNHVTVQELWQLHDYFHTTIQCLYSCVKTNSVDSS